jgi:hypothetical protein
MHAESETLRAAIEKATEDMSADQLAWHPEGKWCTAQIIGHLSLTYSGTAKGLRRVLETGKVNVRPPTWRERLRTFVLVGLGYFPPGREAPQQVVPREENAQNAMSEIHANLSDMDNALTTCEQQFGTSAVVLVHPILGPLKLQQWRKFHRIHCLHHMKQIQGLRARMTQTISIKNNASSGA